MKTKTFCAGLVLSVLCFNTDVSAGALLKDFTKNKSANESSEQAQDPGKSVDNQASEANQSPVIGENSEGKKPVEETSAPQNQTINIEPQQASAAPASEKKIVGDPIVLRINNSKEFRRSQILKEIQKIPPQLLSNTGMDQEAIFILVREQLLKSHLMVEQAKKAGIEKKKEYLDMLETTKNELLARMYLAIELAPKAQNEANLRARYKKYSDEFKPQKEYHLYHIYTKDEQTAKEALDMLAKGIDFSTVAKEKSEDPESKAKGGDAGYAPIDYMPDDAKEKIMALKDGEYTKEYIKFNGGFFILKVDGNRMSSPGKYEDVKKMLESMIMQEEILKMFDRLEKQSRIERFEEDGSVDNRDPKMVLEMKRNQARAAAIANKSTAPNTPVPAV